MGPSPDQSNCPKNGVDSELENGVDSELENCRVPKASPEQARNLMVAQGLDSFLDEHNPQNLLVSIRHGMQERQVLQVLASPEVQHVLKKHGFADLAIEARVEFNDDAKLVASGKMTPAELGEEAVRAYREAGDGLAETARTIYEVRAELVESSSTNGATVHFVEKQGADLKEQVALLNQQGGLNSIVQTRVDTVLSEKGIERTDIIFLNEREIRKQTAEEAAILREDFVASKAVNLAENLRTSTDGKLAQHIGETTGGRKTVVVYGASHGSGENDLDEELAGDTKRVQFVPSAKEYHFASQLNHGRRKEQPDAFLVIESGDVISARQATKDAEDYDL